MASIKVKKKGKEKAQRQTIQALLLLAFVLNFSTQLLSKKTVKLLQLEL